MPRSLRKLISTPFGWVEYTKRKIGCQEKYFICGYYIYGNNEVNFFRLGERVSIGVFSSARRFALPEGTWFRLGIRMALGLMIYFFYSRRHSRLCRQARALFWNSGGTAAAL